MMSKEYCKRIMPLLYYFLFFWKFKKLNIRAVVYFSVRIDGKQHISIGRNSTIQRGGWLFAQQFGKNKPILSIGNNCAIGDYCHIASISKVEIQNSALLANHVYISDNLHDYSNVNIPIQNQQVLHKKDVIIGEGCWIGENVCIIGANVGKNSVIGANSVVLNDIGDYCVAVGSPARVIKKFDFETSKWVKA